MRKGGSEGANKNRKQRYRERDRDETQRYEKTRRMINKQTDRKKKEKQMGRDKDINRF